MFEVSGAGIIQQALDAIWLRQQVISNNIANVDTPNYKSKEVEFEDYLRDFIEGDSKEENIKDVKAKVVENDDTAVREDGNNVDIDKESIELYRSMIQYSYLVNKISGEFSKTKMVLTEGKSL